MQITHSELVLLLQEPHEREHAYLECQGCTVVELRQGEECSIGNFVAYCHTNTAESCASCDMSCNK